MVDLDPKAAGELLKHFAGGDEAKNKFSKTFFGSLLGQLTILVWTLAAYAIAVFALLKYLGLDLKQIREAYGLSR